MRPCSPDRGMTSLSGSISDSEAAVVEAGTASRTRAAPIRWVPVGEGSAAASMASTMYRGTSAGPGRRCPADDVHARPRCLAAPCARARRTCRRDLLQTLEGSVAHGAGATSGKSPASSSSSTGKRVRRPVRVTCRSSLTSTSNSPPSRLTVTGSPRRDGAVTVPRRSVPDEWSPPPRVRRCCPPAPVHPGERDIGPVGEQLLVASMAGPVRWEVELLDLVFDDHALRRYPMVMC